MINYYAFLYGTGCSYSGHTTPNYFDKFGNYVFPTDLVTNTPNIAIGTPSDFLYELCASLEKGKEREASK